MTVSGLLRLNYYNASQWVEYGKGNSGSASCVCASAALTPDTR